ncbi:unnamed protein product, partial [Oikopleura dioica]
KTVGRLTSLSKIFIKSNRGILPEQQCAAVRTQCGETIVPPHPALGNLTSHGHEYANASVPPKILDIPLLFSTASHCTRGGNRGLFMQNELEIVPSFLATEATLTFQGFPSPEDSRKSSVSLGKNLTMTSFPQLVTYLREYFAQISRKRSFSEFLSKILTISSKNNNDSQN